MYLTKDEFLQKFGILPQEFEEADISWEELLEIADDYERRRPTLEKIRKEFVAEFLQDKEKEIGLQSYHSRLKDTEHLVEKLVRKRLENYAKYRKMDATNYMRYVTDLIGIRGLLLYREDWVNFHKYIILGLCGILRFSLLLFSFQTNPFSPTKQRLFTFHFFC